MRVVGRSKQLGSQLRISSENIDELAGYSAPDHEHIFLEVDPLTLLGTYTSYAGFRVPHIYKIGNFVQVEGLVSNAAIATDIAVVPDKYRVATSRLPYDFFPCDFSASGANRSLRYDTDHILKFISPVVANGVNLGCVRYGLV